MMLHYKGTDKAVWKEIVISEKDVGICDIGYVTTNQSGVR